MPVEPITPEIQVQEVSKIPATPGEIAHKYGHTFKKIAFVVATVAAVALTVAIIAAAVFWGAPITIPILAVAATVFIGSGGLAFASKYFGNLLKPIDSIENINIRLYVLKGDQLDPKLGKRLKESCNPDQYPLLMTILNDIQNMQKQINDLPLGTPINKKSLEAANKKINDQIELLPPFAKGELKKILSETRLYDDEGKVISHKDIPQGLPFIKLVPLLKELLGDTYTSNDVKLILALGNDFQSQFKTIQLLEKLKRGESITEEISLIIAGEHDKGKPVQPWLNLFSRILKGPEVNLQETQGLLKDLLGPNYKESDHALISKYSGLDRELKSLINLMKELKSSGANINDPQIAKTILLQTNQLLQLFPKHLEKGEVVESEYLELINRVVALNGDKIPIKWSALRQALLLIDLETILLLRPGEAGLPQRIYKATIDKTNTEYPLKKVGMIKGLANRPIQKAEPFFETGSEETKTLPNDVANNLLEDFILKNMVFQSYVHDEVEHKTVLPVQFITDVMRDNYIIDGTIYSVGNAANLNPLLYDLHAMVDFDVKKAQKLASLLTQANAPDQLAQVQRMAEAHFGIDIVGSGVGSVMVVSKTVNGYVVDIHRSYKLFQSINGNTELLRKNPLDPQSPNLPLVNIHQRIHLTPKDIEEGYLREGSVIQTTSFIEGEYNLNHVKLWTLIRNYIGDDKVDELLNFNIIEELYDPISNIVKLITKKNPALNQQIDNEIEKVAEAYRKAGKPTDSLLKLFKTLRAVK